MEPKESQLKKFSLALPERRNALVITSELGGHIMVGSPNDDPYKHGEVIGELTWGPTGEIKRVHVNRDHRRQSIATTMLGIAKSHEPKLRHSPSRTDEGEAWAKSTGDPLPPRTKVE